MPVDFGALNTNMPAQIAGSFNEGRRNRLSMLAAERQGRMQEMQLGQAERQMADQETLRNMYQESGGDVNVLHQNLMQRGMVKEAQSLQEFTMQQQKLARQQQEEAAKATAMQQYRGQLAPEEQAAFDVAPGAVIKQRLAPPPKPVAPKTRLDLERGVMITEPLDVGGRPTVVPIQGLPPKPVKQRSEAPLSPTAQKELFEAEDVAQSSKNVMGLLDEAMKLNERAYSGVGAKTRAVIRSNIPGESEAADATIALDNLMTGQALESLKSTFGGMPTEGERKILLDIQASAEKTPKQRADIMERAKKAAEKRLKFSQEKARKLRSGEYFGAEEQVTVPEANNDGWSDL